MKHFLLFTFLLLSSIAFGQVMQMDSSYYSDYINGDWVPYGKENFTYGSDFITVLSVTREYETDPWYPTDSTVHTYDNNGNLTSILNHYWDDQTQNWQGSFWYTYTYNGNNQLTEQLYRNWDFVANDWVNGTREEFTYNGSLNTQTTGYYWFDGQWILSGRSDFTYNAFNNVEQIIGYNYDNNLMTWEPVGRRDFSYDGNQNNTEELEYSWVNNAWEESYWNQYTFNNDGYIIQQFYSWWDNGMWRTQVEDVLNRDPSNNLIEALSYDYENDVPELVERVLLTYSLDYDINSLILPLDWIDPEFFENGQLLYEIYEEYDPNSQTFIQLSDTIIFSWTEQPLLKTFPPISQHSNSFPTL